MITVGHGRLGREALTELLTGAGVRVLVDVRRFPASRTNPDVAREVMPGWLAQAGLAYRWVEQLGGRRRLTAGEGEGEDPWWTVEQFRAYAAHTRTPEFGSALRDVLSLEGPTAVMCSESVWWRCHRRLIADVTALGHQLPVRHLMHDGSLRDHPVSAGARRRADGLVVWDVLEPATDR